jgi:hypothetical protein
MYQLFVSTDFGCVLKMLFGVLKMRFLLSAPVDLIWYIRNVFEFLEGSKCVFHLKFCLYSCSDYLIKKLSPPKFRPTYSSLVGRRHFWCLKNKHVPNFEDLKSRKNLLEIYRLFVSTDFGGVKKLILAS